MNQLYAHHFGPDFTFGVSSSAFQTEGAHAEHGKGPSIWDEFTQKGRAIQNRHHARVATGFYQRYEEDLNWIAEAGIEHFRFSTSWPRVLPNGYGQINQKGLDYYDRLVDACLVRGIAPWITLYHWDLPHALELKGGWTNRSTVFYFLEYAQVMAERLGDRVKHWMVLNEPLAFTGAGYFLGIHAPGKRGMRRFLPALHHACLAQAQGIALMQTWVRQANVGTTFSFSPVEAHQQGLRHSKAEHQLDALLNRLFLEPLLGMGYPVQDLPFLEKMEPYIKAGDEQALKAQADFIGLQVYTREIVKPCWWMPYVQAKVVSGKKRGQPIDAMGWEIHPEALAKICRKLRQYPNLPPLVITENGLACKETPLSGRVHDAARIGYFQQSLAHLRQAMAEGSNVNGFFAWSLTDNFEWAKGYEPRFGLIHVDFDTLERTPKDSFFWYQRFLAAQPSGWAGTTKASSVSGLDL